MMTRAQRLRELDAAHAHTQDSVVATLSQVESQVESQVNVGNGALGAVGGGRELQRTVHVLRTLHHGGIQMAWARATHVLQTRLKFVPHITLDHTVCHSQASQKSVLDLPRARTQDFKI